jgi:chemotaxis signal transduction protein
VRWIVVMRGARLLALVVDRVTDVLGAEDAAPREPPAIEAGQRDRGIKSVCSFAGRLVFVLDVDALAALTDELALPASTDAPRAERG